MEPGMESIHVIEWTWFAIFIGLFVTYRMLTKRIPNRRGQKELHQAIHDADVWLKMSSLDLAQAIKEKKISCAEIVDLYIEQLEKVNPHLNAVVGKRYEEARVQAKEYDLLISKSTINLPELFGVPMISKEVHEYPNFPYTSGVPGRRDVVGKKTCPSLQRIEKSGAIILGCGNVSEGCMWSEASNTVFGVSNNPYDIARTCGGSSGGNAAALSALGGSFSITSDVGGSTRIPALYNGLFGHKPSGGAIPNTYTIPKVHGMVERYCQMGPCTRYAKDLFPILKIISGPVHDHEVDHENEDEAKHHETQLTYMRTFDWPDPNSVNLKKLRYFVVRKQPGAQLGVVSKRSPCMTKAQEQVVNAIESNLQTKVQDLEFPELDKCFDIWSAMLQDANGDHMFAQVIGEGKVMRPFWELLKWIFTLGKLSDHTLPALGLAFAESFTKLTPKKNAEMISLGHQLRDRINEILGDDGVIVFPSLPNPAPFHGPMPNFLFFADYAACGILNTLELPATAVPVGFSKENLPTGVQLVSSNSNDHLSIALAMALEEWGVAKWSPPPKEINI